ncbi:MAG: CHAP domain-containing protein [Lachnospiraceae bacterium]|nr:CHAP domain-containing protein [Lachnospiraceae bacterium]
MKNIVNSYVRKFREEHRKSRRTVAMLLALALVVVAGVTWQLHATGIAMTNETFCGLEEHTHTEDCYESVLICGLEETEGHTHDESCYETVTTLVCGLEESEGHTHTEDCYDADGNLICGLEESKGHTHTDACYETEQVLVCGLEESEGHTHTDECYEEQLACGLEEHTHTAECLIDETADVETASDWKATLPELSGVWADDIVEIAKSQLDYTESTANYQLDEDGTTHKGYTRYGAWYGNKYGDWDAMFVSFCLHYAGVDEDDFPQASGVYSWTVSLKKMDLYAEDCTPSAGDLVFFDTDSDGKADHVGIVTEVNEETEKITVIEGNCDDEVKKNTYSLSDSEIIGYGLLPEQEEVEEETEVEAETETYTAEADGVSVTVTAPAGALPENAELVVTLLDEDSDGYASAAEAIAYDAEDEETGMAALDITFYDEDGQKVEPTEAVTVTIDAAAILPEDADASTLEVQHLAETDAGVEPVLVADATGDTEGTVDTETVVAEFEVDGFSTFTISWSNNNTTYFTITVHHVDESGNDLEASTSDESVSVNNNSSTTYTFSDYAADITGYAYSKAAYSSYDGSEVATATFALTQSGGGQGGQGGNTTGTLTLYNSSGSSVYTATYSNSKVEIDVYLIYTKAVTADVTYVNTSGTSISGNTTTSLGQGVTVTLADLATDIDDYTYSYANVTYTYTDSDGETVTGSVEKATSIVYNSDGTYTVGETTIPSGAAVTIELVYENDPSVTLSASGSDAAGYTVTSTMSYFSEYTSVDYSWTISAANAAGTALTVNTTNAGWTVYDGSTLVATITNNRDGSLTVIWADGADAGDNITMTLEVTTYTDGETTTTEKATSDSYRLVYTGAYVTLTSSSNEDGTYTVTATPYEFTGSTYTYTWEIEGSVTATSSSSSTGSLTVTDNGNGTWTVTNEDEETVAIITDNGDGTLTVEWTENAEVGDLLTFSVKITDEDSNSAESEEIELTYGGVTFTVVYTTYTQTGSESNPSGTTTLNTVSGVTVYVYDSEGGDLLCSGTTDSNGQVTFELNDGVTYYVVVSYTSGSGSSATTYSYSGSVTANAADGNVIVLSSSSSYEHIDIKNVTVSSGSGSTTLSISGVTSVVVLDENGEEINSTTSVTYASASQNWQTHWEDYGNNTHSIASFTLDYTVVITYTVYDSSTGETKEYTAIIDSTTTYPEESYYPADGDNAWNLYNYIYGTNYTESDWLSSAAYASVKDTGIDISGMTYFEVAIVLCDSWGGGNGGLDFALDVESLLYLTAGWDFEVQKTYTGDTDGMTAGDFTFNVYNATVSGTTWTLSTLKESYSNSTQAADDEGTSEDTIDFTKIAYNTDDEGTYYYIIYEENNGESGVTYDSTVYGVKIEVTVETDTEGNLTTYTPTVIVTYYVLTGYSVDDDGTVTYSTATETTITETDGVATFPFKNSYTTEETTTDLTIIKMDADEENVYLNGAEFILYYIDEGGTYHYYTYDSTTNTAGWEEVEDEDDAYRITVENGETGVTVYSLTVGTTYYLKEVTAPDGYNLLSTIIVFTLSDEADDGVDINGDDSNDDYAFDSDDGITIIVYNSKGYELPSTGGMGTWMYTLMGLLFCSGAALVLYRRKRLS